MNVNSRCAARSGVVRRCPLRLEKLEDRCVPSASVFGVDTPGLSLNNLQALAASQDAAAGGTTPASADVQAKVRQQYGQLPMQFEQNDGQTDPSVAFLARGAGLRSF